MVTPVEKQLWTTKLGDGPIEASVLIVGESEKSIINRSYVEEDSASTKASILLRCAASANINSVNTNIASSAGNKYTYLSSAMTTSNKYKTGHAIHKVTGNTKNSYTSSVSRSSSGRGRGG